MVVLFDIDGTIVDDESQIIPESAVRAVEALGRNGHLAVVNTGRPLGNIDPRVREMAFRGWICGCGMEVWLDEGWLFRTVPDAALCRCVRDSVRKCGMQVLYEAEDGLLTDGRWSLGPVAVKEAARMHKKGFPIREIDSLPDPAFVKFVTYDTPGCDRQEMVRRMEPWFTCIDRGWGMIEYMLKGCSKAAGMARLLEHLGCAREDTLAIGDSTNDLPMFSLAGHTVCMGGGMEELKREAEFVTASVLDDGIEKALKHFGLI